MQPFYRIGIDLGGTKIESVLLAPDGGERFRHRIATPRHGGYRAILDAVVAMVRQTGAYVPRTSPFSIGVGIPGTIDKATGRVINANTTTLIGHRFNQDLQTALGQAVAMENDANCFTMAESRLGAGRGHSLVFGIIMGTGCGGGICFEGRVRTGPQGIAGEWGHVSVDPRGERCYCGNRGCVETLISGSGVERGFQTRYGRRCSMSDIVSGARRRHPEQAETFNQFLDDFGRCLGGLISVIDPDCVVLGGGLSNIEELYTQGLARVRHYAFHPDPATPVVKNQLGDSAGVLGAAWIGGGSVP